MQKIIQILTRKIMAVQPYLREPKIYVSVVVILLLGGGVWKAELSSPVELKALAPHSETPTPAPAPAHELEVSPVPSNIYEVKKWVAVGNYGAALDLAISEGSTFPPPWDEWIKNQLPHLYAGAAWIKIKLGNCQEAMPLLLEGVALKETVELSKGLAVCYFKEKNLIDGEAYFLSYLARNPDDVEFKRLFSELLQSHGRYKDALAMVEGVSDPGAEQRAQELSRRLDLEMVHEHEGAFKISYEAGIETDLDLFAREVLDDALNEYSQNYGLTPPDHPIEVELYLSNDFSSLNPKAPQWAEGIYDSRMKIPLPKPPFTAEHRELFRVVLRHELLHALVAERTDHRRLPSWFEEGVAQYASCIGQRCQGFQFEPTPGQFLSEDILSKEFISLSSLDARRAYRQSYYLIKMLVKTKGIEGLRQVLAKLAKDTSITPDAILAPTALTWAELYAQSKEAWAARQVLGSE